MRVNKPFATVKHKNELDELLLIHPVLLGALSQVFLWCHEYEVPCVITSMVRTPSENVAVGAVSQTHTTGRAVDLSVRGWSADQVESFVNWANMFFQDIAAVNRRGEPRFAVYHVGTAPHLHLQIHRKYELLYDWPAVAMNRQYNR
mgnify:CR=1 FL=1